MIPRIIHQIWKTSLIPAAYEDWSSSWQRFNPDFEYKLWTHRDIENLLDRDFPEYRSVFYGYEENIHRIDFAKYLILKKHGGLLVNLDVECLRPQDALIAGKTCVLGQEPDLHRKSAGNERPGLPYLASNAWMSSTPNHAFWDHLLQHITGHSGTVGPAHAEGSFLLTEALLNYSQHDVDILPAEVLYPVNKEDCQAGKLNDLEFFANATRSSYAIGHWKKLWSTPEPNHLTLALPRITYRVIDETKSASRPYKKLDSERPLISCLMVSRGNPDFVRSAIEGYLKQTYSNTELVIVTRMAKTRLALLRSEYRDARIRWKFINPDAKIPLGALRNISLDEARGDYIANWDDDDLHDPTRLSHQLNALHKTQVPACMLMRLLIWWPSKRRIFMSHRRPWEGSLLCRKDIMPRYPEIGKREDTALIDTLMASHKVTVIDAPRLYTYVVHDENTWHDAHFEHLYKISSVNFSARSYDRIINEMARRVGIRTYPTAAVQETV